MVSFMFSKDGFPCLLPAYLLKRSVRKASGATSENVSVVKILMFSRATPAPGAMHVMPCREFCPCWTKYQHWIKKDALELRTSYMPFNCIYFLNLHIFFSQRNSKKLNCSHGSTRTHVVLSVHACDFCGKLCNRLTSARATQHLLSWRRLKIK